MIVRATVEYPFRQTGEKRFESHANHPLVDDVKKWSRWVLQEAKKDLADFFPAEERSETVGYLWSRCIPCQNPRCGITIPLIRQFWLANTDKRKIAMIPAVKGKKVSFTIAGSGQKHMPKDFDPANATTSGGKVTCLACQHRMDGNRVKTLFAQGENTERMNIVVTKTGGRSGKIYAIPTNNDFGVFQKASDALKKKRNLFQQKYRIDPVPNESLPPSGTLGFRIQKYGMKTWGDLFNDRQKLVLLTFMEKILQAAEKMSEENNAQALPYLTIIFDRLVDKNATLCMYDATREEIAHVFGRQALPIVWDYAEVNPFTSVGWPNMEQWVLRVLNHLSAIDAKPAVVRHASAAGLPFSDQFFDAVFTDPPYYDNVPYSHLSDFFYVWMKRIVGAEFPDLFSTPLTPKGDEIVAYSNGPGGREAGKTFFEKMLAKSFSEIHRVLKPDGISVIVYAHKSTEGWETLIKSILRSGLVVTAAWPIHTEMKGRLRSKKSAALLSSIYMVCRKQQKEPVGFYRDVRRDLKLYLDKKLDQLWDEDISGADFFIASIGSAIEVYGRYDRVMDDKDRDVPVLRMLEDTRTIVTNYAIDRVIRGEFADKISKMTRFYILWRWAHGEAKAPFDEALKLAQSVGISLEQEWDRGFIKKDAEYVRVVGPDERMSDDLEESDELIDVLHRALILWRGQRLEAADKFLAKKGYKDSEVLRRVAQAVSESLADAKDSKEKDWIDGMFTGISGMSPDEPSQTKLF